MGHEVSSGGGQSSLNYLFGSGEAPKPSTKDAEASLNDVQAVNHSPKPSTAPKSFDVSKQIPAGINSTATSGQNTGNFLTLFLLFMSFFLAVEALHAFIQDESEHKNSNRLHFSGNI